MGLIACPECNHSISDKAVSCPQCGYPMRVANGRGTWPSVLSGVATTYLSTNAVVLIVLGAILFIAFAAIMVAVVLSS
ncbi:MULTISPECIES: zinc ribbon domain-containing protein [Rhizobium]|uniref:Zinc-ribbon domain-containing protein n=1 Tax=Rhizobium wuzhouense TaxID=1986026 RepID=A0ABX5NTF0_9HYPH|nr:MULTISPECIES: zinc ribbon domain-containing protein [Rhizobium]PYB73362.1 hypothetical protein DMY87_13800 [Rhizobium wuzhouense]RKE84079.1 zinc ribbon protein [Rhizobium sp. AG855]